MRKMKKILMLTTLLLTISIVTMAYGASVTPVLYEDWHSGNAEYECDEAGCICEFAYKIDGWGSGKNGAYVHSLNTITIKNSNAYTFDWESKYPVFCVIVSGGSQANVFYYEGGAISDENLYAPLNPHTPDPNDTFGISHVTFCWCEPPDFVIPEAPIGTISTLMAMLGAGLLLRTKRIPLK
jgi:hypothetical protein